MTHPVPLPCSKTPAEPVILAIAAFPMLPPDPTRRGLQRLHDFEAATGLQYPLSTLHERRYRRPCKTRFRLAGSASTGRASNPLGHDERFQVTSILLSRTCPDASWAHVRRKFFDFHHATGSPIAAEALRRIAELYQVEARIRGRPSDQRARIRQAESRPLVDAMKKWLEGELGRVSAKSILAEAIRYALRHWKGLGLFLEDGRVEIDSNTVERTIRPIKLGAKNHLFAGSDGGAESWAIVASLIQTAKLNEVEPFAYLRDVLERIVSGKTKANELGSLLPWAWKASQAQAAVNI